jgi:transcriptional regulator with GAF, ATPase, and Fis domain
MGYSVTTIPELREDIYVLKQRIKELEYSEAESKRAEQEMTVLSDIGCLIDSTIDIHEIYEQFAAEAKKLIPFDSLSINLYNSQENTACAAYVSGLGINGRRQGDPIVLEGSLSEAVIRTRTSLCIQSASIDEIVGQFPKLVPIFQAGIRSIMCVPLVSQDEVIGPIGVQDGTILE